MIDRTSEGPDERAREFALLERTRGGDERAFHALALHLSPRLRRVASRLTHGPASADEIVQDALLRLHRSPPQLREGVSLHTWMYKVLLNLSRDVHRRSVREERHVPLDETVLEGAEVEPDAPARLHAEERRRWVREAMTELSESAREVLTLRYDAELEYSEIAAVLDCPVGTVGSKLHRALHHLGEVLTRSLPSGELP